jgi:hypothetical protein
MSPPASIDFEGFFFKRCSIGRVETQRLRRKFQNDLAMATAAAPLGRLASATLPNIQSRSSHTISNPLPKPELYGKLGNSVAFPDLHWLPRGRHRSIRRMNREYHAVVSLSPSLESLDIIVKHTLTSFALHLHKSNLIRSHILGLNVGSLSRPAQLCHSNPAGACQDEIDEQLKITIMKPFD